MRYSTDSYILCFFFISVADKRSSFWAVLDDPVVCVIFGQDSTMFPLGWTVWQHPLVFYLVSIHPEPWPSQEAQAYPDLRHTKKLKRSVTLWKVCNCLCFNLIWWKRIVCGNLQKRILCLIKPLTMPISIMPATDSLHCAYMSFTILNKRP